MSVVTAVILSDGKTLNVGDLLMHIDILRELNRIPVGRLTLADGSIADRRFEVSQSTDFQPGKEIEIRLRREGEGQSASLFKGIVVSQNIEADFRQSTLTVELRDMAFKLSTTRKTSVFNDKKDSDIISQLIREQGLQAGKIESTPLTHKEMVQYQCSDWDFILLRAEANGLVVHVNNGKISVQKPELSTAAHHYEYGMSPIYSLELRADAAGQLGVVKTAGWDPKNQQAAISSNSKEVSLSPGALNPKTLAGMVGAKELALSSPAWMEKQELQSWADSLLMRSRLALVRGWLSVEGDGALSLLQTLNLKGISAPFNGDALITGLRQQFGAQGWRTDIQLGLSSERFAQSFNDLAEPPANGLLPAIKGLHIAQVTKLDEDPAEQFRVKVRIAAWPAGQDELWVRVLMPDAGNKRGFFFLPELNDEVVVGFLNDDPRQGVIVGSLYNTKNAPPVPKSEINKKNNIKGIYSREGIKLQFDDENKTLTITTVDKQQVVLNGKDKKVEISDANNNSILMDNNGVSIKSARDIKIEASGKVEIKGSQVDVK